MIAGADPRPGKPGGKGSKGGKGGNPARGCDPFNFGDLVWLALHSAADQVEPCTDGLIPIRARILARAGVPWRQAFAMSRYWLGPK